MLIIHSFNIYWDLLYPRHVLDTGDKQQTDKAFFLFLFFFCFNIYKDDSIVKSTVVMDIKYKLQRKEQIYSVTVGRKQVRCKLRVSHTLWTYTLLNYYLPNRHWTWGEWVGSIGYWDAGCSAGTEMAILPWKRCSPKAW